MLGDGTTLATWTETTSTADIAQPSGVARTGELWEAVGSDAGWTTPKAVLDLPEDDAGGKAAAGTSVVQVSSDVSLATFPVGPRGPRSGLELAWATRTIDGEWSAVQRTPAPGLFYPVTTLLPGGAAPVSWAGRAITWTDGSWSSAPDPPSGRLGGLVVAVGRRGYEYIGVDSYLRLYAQRVP